MTPEFLALPPMKRLIILSAILPEVIKDQEAKHAPADCRIWSIQALCEALILGWVTIDQYIQKPNSLNQ